MPIKYLIWSLEHKAWWKSESMGYTNKIEDAGKYSLKEATDVVDNANKYSFNECMIPEHALSKPSVVSVEDIKKILLEPIEKVGKLFMVGWISEKQLIKIHNLIMKGRND